MDMSLLAAAALGGFIYGILPGPGVLAVLGIGAAQGRIAGAGFLGGHLVGDAVWSALAITAIIGVKTIGSAVFDVLGVISGLYLFWLGVRAVRARRSTGTPDVAMRRPLAHGLVFGLTNPKAYPVAVATFTALLSSRAHLLTWGMMPVLVLASLVGGLMAYAILVAIVGAAAIRRGYRRHEVLITRASGLLFMGFAVHTLLHAGPDLVWRPGRR